METGNPSRKTLGLAKKLRNQKSRDLVQTLETGPAVTKTNTGGEHDKILGNIAGFAGFGRISD